MLNVPDMLFLDSNKGIQDELIYYLMLFQIKKLKINIITYIR